MEKKLTAMMELIEWLKPYADNQPYLTPEEVLQKAESLLPKEREQMIDFADAYANDVMGGCMKPASDYYTQDYQPTE